MGAAFGDAAAGLLLVEAAAAGAVVAAPPGASAASAAATIVRNGIRSETDRSIADTGMGRTGRLF
jgi:hypothetical protein